MIISMARPESSPYWQDDIQPFSSEQEHNISWHTIGKAIKNMTTGTDKIAIKTMDWLCTSGTCFETKT